MKSHLIDQIMELLRRCDDLQLLDVIYRLLAKSL